MKLLCDEMLIRHGQWLRVAGHDVLILPGGSDDRTLYDRAREEGRLLLTRDRKMAEYLDAERHVVVLACNDLDDCAAALNRRLTVDWLYRPFSRCMACNTPLVEAPAGRRNEVPEEVKRTASRVLYCPECDQLFWHGSHVERMYERLRAWSE